MKFRTIALSIFVCLGAACGDDVEKDPSANGTANNSTTTNNATTNNATTPDDSCESDNDCTAEGEVCFATECVPTCARREDCTEDELCLPRLDGNGKTCQPTECVSDRTCIEFYGAEAVCAEDGFCDAPERGEPTGIERVKIEDITTGGDQCASSDPGSDLMGIELVDAQGNSRGWGNIVSDEVVVDGNGELNFEVINGDRPALDADGCVDSFSGNVLSLGCGGSILIEFLDNADNAVVIRERDEIFVYEYGGICSNGTFDDQWEVFLCNGATCMESLGTGGGIDSVVVE